MVGGVGMQRGNWRNYLCDILVDDVGEHGVHCSNVMQCASRIAELSLVVFPKSNL